MVSGWATADDGFYLWRWFGDLLIRGSLAGSLRGVWGDRRPVALRHHVMTGAADIAHVMKAFFAYRAVVQVVQVHFLVLRVAPLTESPSRLSHALPEPAIQARLAVPPIRVLVGISAASVGFHQGGMPCVGVRWFSGVRVERTEGEWLAWHVGLSDGYAHTIGAENPDSVDTASDRVKPRVPVQNSPTRDRGGTAPIQPS